MNTVTAKTTWVAVNAVAATLVAALLATSAAVATTQERGEAAKVHYSDLSIASAEGAQQLFTRLSHAARDVCTLHGDPLRWAAQHSVRSCYEATLSRAVAQVSSPRLTAEFNHRFPNSAQQVSTASRGVRSHVG